MTTKSYYVKVPCEECDGKGVYDILNAYDADYKETITCEFCGGEKVVIKKIDSNLPDKKSVN